MSSILDLTLCGPGCRITITSSRPRRRKTPPQPKKEIGDLKLRGHDWFRWDYNRTREGHYLVSRRGKHQMSWQWDREATSEELATARAERKAKRGAKKVQI